MAKANQQKWFADALLSAANGYRSFEARNIPAAPAVATPAMQPGTLLSDTGVVSTTANGTAGTGIFYILLQSVPARLANAPSIPALVLARDAEANDAYILYAAMDRDAANNRLAALNIIVRPGVMLTSQVVVVAEGELPTEPEPEHVPA